MLPPRSTQAQSFGSVQLQNLARLAFALKLVSLTPETTAQSLELGTVLDGDTPSNKPPWLIATFSNSLPGQVILTLQSLLDAPSEFFGEIALNLNPAFNPASLTFLQRSGPTLEGPPSLSENGIKLPGAGNLGAGFDILLSWPTANGPNRFNGTDTVSFDITGPASLTFSDFDYYNTVNGQDGEAIIGAHLQGILLGSSATGSGAIIQDAPEPRSLAIFVLAFTAFALFRARAGCARGTGN